MAKFRTMARAVDLLGKNQIADLPTAITEIWKNGYDAYGDKLCADLFKSGCGDITRDIFIISDDGYGMDQDDLFNKWVVLGTASKAKLNNASIVDTFGKKTRIPLGAKGIGRLSVSYLGNHMLMITKKAYDDINALFMNWKVLNNPNLFLDDIEIPIRQINDIELLPLVYYDLIRDFSSNLKGNKWLEDSELLRSIEHDLGLYGVFPDEITEFATRFFNDNNHGTVFIIFDPIDELTQISEIDDSDTGKERFKYLKSTLSGLFNPLDKELTERRETECGKDYYNYPALNIHFPDGTMMNVLGSEGEFFTKDDFKDCEHWIDGDFDEQGVFRGRIKVYGQVIDNYQYAVKQTEALKHCGSISLHVAFWEGKVQNSTMPREKWELYERKGDVFSGLYIYRDGFRVLPYGRTENDFLEFEKRRSLNAGRYYFSHRKMFGSIEITRSGNPALIDKAGREGLVSNAAYRELRDVLKEFFIAMADEHYGTKAQARTEMKEAKAREDRRKEIIREEKQEQVKHIKEIRKRIYKNLRELSTIEAEIDVINQKCIACGEDEYFDTEMGKSILNSVNSLQNRFNEIEIRVSPDIDIEHDEEAYNDYTDYQRQYRANEKRLKDLVEEVQRHIYINTLKEKYVERYWDLSKQLGDDEEETIEQIDCKGTEIKSEINASYSTGKTVLEKFLPSRVSIDSIREEETRKLLSKMEAEVQNWEEEYKGKISHFLAYYADLHVFDDELERRGAMHHTINQLSDENDLFLEMAQIGMSVQQQDHQMNALYGKIKDSISAAMEGNLDHNVERKLQTVSMLFSQLEEIYKKMQPLYRLSKRKKKWITGNMILSTIEAFYGERMKKENITLRQGNGLENYTIFTYESILLPVILNIIDNAIFWLKEANEKIIEIFTKNSNELVIANSGAAMKPAEMEKCFTQFYSKKPLGRGLGLYLAKTTLKSVDLNIWTTADTEYNKHNGACFIISEGITDE